MALLIVLLIICAFPVSRTERRLKEFHISKNKYNVSTALHICTINFTHLATVYDQKDNDELVNLTGSALSAIIGAHTNNENSTNKWSTGDGVTFTNLTGNCTGTCGAVMKADGSWDFVLYNHFNKYFMCFDKAASRSYILIGENKTWHDAQLYCRTNHTDLVTIRNQRENDIVKNTANESQFPFWIGLLHDNVEWVDGGQSAYRKYSGKGTGTFTLLLQRQEWIITNASLPSTFKVLCYKSLIRVSDTIMSWEDALDFCGDAGLLRIESASDQMETERELRKRKISGPVWLGLRQSRLFGFWFWANGLNAEHYQNWKDGLQPEHQRSHHCGAMEEIDGSYKWTDKDCRSKFRVLCEAT